MRRILLALITTLALIAPAQAFQGNFERFDFGTGGGGTPSFFSAPLLSSLVPTKGSGGTFTRNSVQYNYAASASVSANVPMFEAAGYLSEPASTNYFLNSASPVTQNISVTTANSGKWTVTVWGAGTVTTSAGTATATGYGVAQAGTPNTVTVTVNGTVTFTVAGADATTKVNVENTAYGSSFISTAGATATRASTVLAYPISNLPTTGNWAVKIAFTPKMAGSASTAVRTLWSSYKDASNWVSLNYNGVILYAEINKAGTKEYVTKPLTTVAGTTYNVVLKQENGRLYLYAQAAKGSDGLGAELITNAADREFSSDTGFWTKGAGWSIGSGVATGGNQFAALSRSLLTPLKIYSVSYTLAVTSGSLRIKTGTFFGATQTASGTYTEALPAETAVMYFETRAATNNLTIDNVSIKEVSNSTTATAFTLGTTFEVGSFNGTQQAQANFSNLTIYGNLGDAKAISLATP